MEADKFYEIQRVNVWDNWSTHGIKNYKAVINVYKKKRVCPANCN